MNIRDVRLKGIVRAAAIAVCAALCVPAFVAAGETGPGGETVLAEAEIRHVHRGSSSSSGGCYTVPVYHVHQGNETEGGACYTPVYHVHSSACGIETRTCSAQRVAYSYIGERSCWCSVHKDFQQLHARVTRYHDCTGSNSVSEEWCGCQYCGQQEPSQTAPHTYTVTHCGKDGSDIDGYRLSCTKSAETVDRYDPGCGLEEGKSYGSIRIVNLTPDWQSARTTVSERIFDPENVLSGKISENCVFKDAAGNVIADSVRSIRLTENGTYYAVVNADPSVAGQPEYTVGFRVTNIDRTAPVIDKIGMNRDTYCRVNTVTVEASDPQPDGSAGSGESDRQYSFDGGTTWQQEASKGITENKNYVIEVKDACGNRASEMIEINNIDSGLPEYHIEKPDTWHEGEGGITIKIIADDSGSGLDDRPYSFDGGQTWTDDPEYEMDEPGKLDIRVRDRVGNESGEVLDQQYTKLPDTSGSGSSGNGGQTGPAEGDSSADEASEAETKTETAGKGSIHKLSDPAPAAGAGDGGNDDGSSNNAGSVKAGSVPAADGDSPAVWAALPAAGGKDANRTETAVEGGLEVKGAQNAPDTEKEIKYTGSGIVRFLTTAEFKAAAASTGAVLGIALLLFAGWIMYRGIRIYNYDTGKYRYMGLALVRSGTNGFEVILEDHIREEAYTGRYMLRPFGPFLRRHANSDITVRAGELRVTRLLEKCINVEMRER